MLDIHYVFVFKVVLSVFMDLLVRKNVANTVIQNTGVNQVSDIVRRDVSQDTKAQGVHLVCIHVSYV